MLLLCNLAVFEFVDTAGERREDGRTRKKGLREAKDDMDFARVARSIRREEPDKFRDS